MPDERIARAWRESLYIAGRVAGGGRVPLRHGQHALQVMATAKEFNIQDLIII